MNIIETKSENIKIRNNVDLVSNESIISILEGYKYTWSIIYK